MRSLLLWILVLHVLHLPIPVPDLDGECRGAPILSLSEMQAWHVLMLGVRPNDDIDRGPIRTDDDRRSETPSDSPFGDCATNAVVSVVVLNGAFGGPNLSTLPHCPLANAFVAGRLEHTQYLRDVIDSAAAPAVRALLCVWCI